MLRALLLVAGVAVMLLLSILLSLASLAPHPPDDLHPGQEHKLRAAAAAEAEEDDENEYRDIPDTVIAQLDQGFFMAVEQAAIAPVHRIGVYGLEVGGAFANSLVVLTSLDDELYVGFIVNHPLNEDEAKRARAQLHIHGKEVQGKLPQCQVWLGVGGPVRLKDEEWTPIHLHDDIEDAVRISATGLSVGGDIEQLLARESDTGYSRGGFMLLYGRAQWMAGQLEREIDEGAWEIVRREEAFPWPFGSLPLMVSQSHSQDQANAPWHSREAKVRAAAARKKTGDKGTSSLYNGERRSKEDQVFEALGATDELNAAVGVARELCLAEPKLQPMAGWLEDIMSRLLDVGSAVATPRDSTESESKLNRTAFGDGAVTKLELLIDQMDTELPELKNFILPGGGLSATHLHVARTACRRAERQVWPLIRSGAVDDVVGRYLNRLSDFLFTCARYAAFVGGHKEVVYCKERVKA